MCVTPALLLLHRSYKDLQRQAFAKPGNGRGVLIVAGGRDMFANAAITVMVLRRALRSSLPVEIVHYGAKERPAEVVEILQAMNGSSYGSSEAGQAWTPGPVYVTDAYEAAPPHKLGWHHKETKEVKSFPAKVYALAFVTRFQQVRGRRVHQQLLLQGMSLACYAYQTFCWFCCLSSFAALATQKQMSTHSRPSP